MIHHVAVVYAVLKSSPSLKGRRSMMVSGRQPTSMCRMHTYVVALKYNQFPGVILQLVVPCEDKTVDFFTSKKEPSQQGSARKHS